MKRVYVAGTADTKGQELLYVKSLIQAERVQWCWSMSAPERPPFRSMSRPQRWLNFILPARRPCSAPTIAAAQ